MELEGRILRDRITEVGGFLGAIAGLAYGITAQDSEGASMILGIIKGMGGGCVAGAGFAYCAGNIVYIARTLGKSFIDFNNKPIYNQVSK